MKSPQAGESYGTRWSTRNMQCCANQQVPSAPSRRREFETRRRRWLRTRERLFIDWSVSPLPSNIPESVCREAHSGHS
ncbi:hypothetical protein I7I48_03777 [Histoplasma ohiense]|nr:hypothetical protein I7I48_03777 [Histoplasma ohiense (nom. inval.)]